jgi:hypothetical protein
MKGFRMLPTFHPPFPSCLPQSHRPTQRTVQLGQVKKGSLDRARTGSLSGTTGDLNRFRLTYELTACDSLRHYSVV